MKFLPVSPVAAEEIL